ncbi:MAG: hypothetical protein JJU33_06840 [Phycisphaerales bacterium]|nr:hypothetical protein [Phycisphaerales bacterium]
MLLIAGADPSDPRAISECLGLNKGLAWKISKIVQAEDPFVVLQQMPGAPGLRMFVRANERAGVGDKPLGAVKEAIAEYDRMITLHSGDRATMEIMGSTLSPSSRQQIDEQHRKQFFQGASSIWGVQARTILKLGLVGPSDHKTLDFVSINALIDLKRLRQVASWPLAVRHAINDDGTQMTTNRIEAIDGRFSGPDDPPLMADFCSQPLPEILTRTSDGQSSFELAGGRVGNTGAMTCVFGTVQRSDIPFFATPENQWGGQIASCDTPAELLIMDMYVHSSLPFPMPPEAVWQSHMSALPPPLEQDPIQLPLHERVQDLGSGPLPVATPEVKAYNKLARAAFDRVGWDPSEFRGFRIKLVYPPCPTSLMLRYPLPERPR